MSTGAKLSIALLVAVVIAFGIGVDLIRSDSRTRTLWQQAVIPGGLSQSHAFLSDNCVACHTPVQGVEPTLCIACHARNTALLQRQPTAFHASIQSCTGCHVEHQGTVRMPTTMDHSLLARVGHRELRVAEQGVEPTLDEIEAAVGQSAEGPRRETQAPTSGAPHTQRERCGSSADCFEARATAQPPSARGLRIDHPRLNGDQSMLNCGGCHATKDRHRGLFGADCVQCHATTQWSIADFRHPSARSTECAQCHQPPPSHNMMHFSMMSASIARQPNAQLNQCYLCHQTTSWNDIKGVGLTKHH
jgi:hypothetical protein